MEKRKIWAVVRGLAAVVLAMTLLAVSGFAVGRFLGGPEAITEGDQLKNGAYVEAKLDYIMDVIGVERSGSGTPRAYYAVAPIGNRFVTVRFPASDYENMTALESATKSFLLGESEQTGFRLVITGMAKGLGEDAASLLAQWFSENGPWMTQAGVIGEVSDYGDYLSGYCVRSGDVGSMSYAVSMTLTVLAFLLLVYAVVVFTRLGLGRYGGKEARHG